MSLTGLFRRIRNRPLPGRAALPGRLAFGVPLVDEELVVVELGTDPFEASLIVARLRSEGIAVQTWDNSTRPGRGIYLAGGGTQLLVHRDDLPAVEAALADAGHRSG